MCNSGLVCSCPGPEKTRNSAEGDSFHQGEGCSFAQDSGES